MLKIIDQSDSRLRKILKKRKQPAIIPVGSLEQHGPHLPVSTDSDIISEIAKRVAKKCNFLLLPTIFYGVSLEHTPFFNLSLKNSTLIQLITDICVSLSENNVKTIFILNGHHGNQKALNEFSSKIKQVIKKEVRIFVFSYWHFMKHEFDHAGFVETSIMLAISKKVNMKMAKKGLITKDLSKSEIARLSKLASKSFPAVAKNGVWGDPTTATATDGNKILAEIVKNIVKTSQTYLTEKNRKLHQ
jgi:creatinine amidohydrolase